MDREIKDEEAQNPPEVNKRLNDEKQSMVNPLKLALSSSWCECKKMHNKDFHT